MTLPDQPADVRHRRRLHSDEFKANAVAACMQPGISMAAIAMAHGINANLLRRWVRQVEMKASHGRPAKSVRNVEAPPVKSVFVPLALPAPTTPTPPTNIRIELQRGATAVAVTWPASAASECAAWMRELLR